MTTIETKIVETLLGGGSVGLEALVEVLSGLPEDRWFRTVLELRMPAVARQVAEGSDVEACLKATRMVGLLDEDLVLWYLSLGVPVSADDLWLPSAQCGLLYGPKVLEAEERGAPIIEIQALQWALMHYDSPLTGRQWRRLYRSYKDLTLEMVLLYVAVPALLEISPKSVAAAASHVGGFSQLRRDWALCSMLLLFGKQYSEWARRVTDPAEVAGKYARKLALFQDQEGVGAFLLKFWGKVGTPEVRRIARHWSELSSPLQSLLLSAGVGHEDLVEAVSPELRMSEFLLEMARWDYTNDQEYLEDWWAEYRGVPQPSWCSLSASEASGLVGYFLRRDDVRGLFLGDHTNCCQHPGGAGEASAFWGAAEEGSGFFIVEDREGDTVAQSWVWTAADGSVVFDNVEARGLGTRHAAVLGLYQVVADQLVELGTPKVLLGLGHSDLEGLEALPLCPAPVCPCEYTDAVEQVAVLAEGVPEDSYETLSIESLSRRTRCIRSNRAPKVVRIRRVSRFRSA